jgi:hypothetical protein
VDRAARRRRPPPAPSVNAGTASGAASGSGCEARRRADAGLAVRPAGAAYRPATGRPHGRAPEGGRGDAGDAASGAANERDIGNTSLAVRELAPVAPTSLYLDHCGSVTCASAARHTHSNMICAVTQVLNNCSSSYTTDMRRRTTTGQVSMT